MSSDGIVPLDDFPWSAVGRFFLCALLGFVVGCMFCCRGMTSLLDEKDKFQKEAIENGVGRYDPKTGKFQFGAYDEKTHTLVWVEEKP